MLEKVMLGITALLAIGILYVSRDSIPQVRALLNPTPSGAGAAAYKVPSSAGQTQAKQKSVVHKSATSEPDVLPPVVTQSAPIVVRVPLCCPQPGQIRSGMRQADVIEKFGDPDSQAVWTDSSTLNQKLVYRDKTKSTAVLIQGGKVVSTRTEAETNHSISSREVKAQW
ncbi:MAG: hypothetical protein U0Q18_32060 [Bryobacteraceae bacterium]